MSDSIIKSDGFSGISVLYPLLIIGILTFALLMSFFFAAWVYQDCKKRNGGGILWALIVIATTPFIGLILYFLRRPEIKKDCAACGGINSDVTSKDKIWNIGSIHMNYESYLNGIWKLDFKNASDGFIAEHKMIINDAQNDSLYADVTCGDIPKDASLTLYLVQNDTLKTIDVTNLTDPLKYSLSEFKNGKIRVRLLIQGVENTKSEITIK